MGCAKRCARLIYSLRCDKAKNTADGHSPSTPAPLAGSASRARRESAATNSFNDMMSAPVAGAGGERESIRNAAGEYDTCSGGKERPGYKTDGARVGPAPPRSRRSFPRVSLGFTALTIEGEI
ncbi:hypothetical protein EVAR_93156_1 [Eumeta japonica]|uniref:Uncharacterized protein n=1 Tax=Eumeta variegata TaxID=151549 RepID=A0A4C1TFC7_EUMVA|nr:hypothetical protein EVAR_93156_1 [Eumeta japonica]